MIFFFLAYFEEEKSLNELSISLDLSPRLTCLSEKSKIRSNIQDLFLEHFSLSWRPLAGK